MKNKLSVLTFCLLSCSFVNQANVASIPAFADDNSDFNRQIEARRKLLDEELTRLEKSDYLADLRKALQKKDFRFVGYFGFTVIVPAVADGQANRYVLKYGANAIKGTSDIITEQESQRLQKVVRLYVIPYNQRLMKHLQETRKISKQKLR